MKKGGHKRRPFRGQTAVGYVVEACACIKMQSANRIRNRPKSSRLASRQKKAILIALYSSVARDVCRHRADTSGKGSCR
jgi:hypothetical protein